MITSDIERLRDPFILAVNGVYYAYGTGWVCYKNTSGNLAGHWELIGTVAEAEDAIDCRWAPEVYFYRGAYYMFTTYKSKATGRRGCTVLKSASPEGPFTETANRPLTPKEWDCIDGTFYLDANNRPWMVFVREWVSAPGNIGSFAAAELSEDLTHFVSEPFELFYANEPAWAVANVTDGCFLHTTADGSLLMLWSNFSKDGYVVAVARSTNGKLNGNWIHEEKLLYSKTPATPYDGGHGMLFTGFDGQLYLAFHSPNKATNDRKERPCFLAVKEENGGLVPVSP